MMHDLARAMIRDMLRRRPIEPYKPDDQRVVIVRPDHLGDLLFVRPALKRFREQLPGVRVTLMIGPWSRSIVEYDANVDEIVSFPFPGFTRARTGSPIEPYRQLFEAARLMRERRPVAVVILRDDHWWGALAARQAGVPLVTGSDHPSLNELLTERVPVQGLHAVERNAAILDAAARRLGSTIEFPVPSFANAPLIWSIRGAERQRAHSLLTDHGIEQPFVVIHPGSGARVKLWPAERWARLAARLSAAGHTVLLTGSASEKPLLQRISAMTESTHELGGCTTIPELAAVFDQATAVLGVDSGPLHLAVAAGTPTIHLYGPSDETIYGPWGDPHRHRVLKAALTCPDCGNLDPKRPEGSGCMLAIDVDQVAQTFGQWITA